MAPIPRLRDYTGPALLSHGFRPFFLFGSLYAGLAILAWLPVFYGELELSTAFAPRDWHIHEMLYGYLPAVIITRRGMPCFLSNLRDSRLAAFALRQL